MTPPNRYSVGDLIKPLGTCGGEPGQIRCNVAFVTDVPNDRTDLYTYVCKCGKGRDYEHSLDPLQLK